MTSDNHDDIGSESAGGVPEKASGPNATVTVTGPGVDITRSVDEKKMADVIAILFGSAVEPSRRLGTAARVTDDDSRSQAAQQSSTWDEELTLSEFIDDSGAKTFQQKICVTGFFLMRQGAESFSREEVKAALEDAHEDMPAKFTRDFNEAAAKSLVARRSGEQDRYIIPRTGRTAIESHFQDLPKRRAARKSARKPSAKNGSSE